MRASDDYLASLREDIRFQAELDGVPLSFVTTWGLFSPRDIDEGTRLLIPRLVVEPDSRCLDLGCGYGPIGLAMAKKAPLGQVLMVDKDFVAIDYARKNIELNQADNAEAMLSNGFDQIPPERRFDVIVSNIPAKVGKELLTLWLHDAWRRLAGGGRFYVVTINGLRQFMKRNLNEVFGNYKKLKQGAHYTVAVASKPND
ncbi:MAG TPA: methyltransferase domain-containing protein [Gammaproteobacteria bacterium]|nr:methyltransferase domain-containing protein [Gammaproteobacteria bacterium]